MLTAVQKTRVTGVIVGFLTIGVTLWVRLLWLGVLEPDHWVSLARRQHLEVLELQPTRGAIRDRNLKPLAMSLRLSSVFGDPRHIKNPRRLAQRLAPLLDQPVQALEKKLSDRRRGFVWLARKISNRDAARIRAARLEGIHLIMEPQRVYPHGRLACHVVGFAGLDAQGLEGMECSADRLLRGEPGWRWLSQDARRRYLGTWETPGVAPRDGLELVLTLDTTLQYIAERELDRAYRNSHAQAASIVVMDPFTGEILAMANRPDYDPNHFGRSPPEHRRNRAVTDPFEPGSVFKIVTAAVALGTGAVGSQDRYDCEQGAWAVAGRILHDHRPHGWLTFEEVVRYSSNIGMAKVAMQMGGEAIYRGIRAFGFGETTGLALPGEAAGRVKHPREWSKTSITVIPMGHEVTVTTVQLAQAISVVANGGRLVRPQLVREVRERSGAVVQRFRPQVARRVLAQPIADELKRILVGAVREGTGRQAQVPGFQAAGKTGTAQKVEPGGGYSHSRFVASFIGFVPAEAPRLAIAVTLDEPRGLYYGGVVAAPVFREVAVSSLAYLQQGTMQLLSASGPQPMVPSPGGKNHGWRPEGGGVR